MKDYEGIKLEEAIKELKSRDVEIRNLEDEVYELRHNAKSLRDILMGVKRRFESDLEETIEILERMF